MVDDEGAGVNLPPWRLEGVFGAGAVDLISQAGDGALPLVIEVAHRRDSTDAVLCPQDQRILCGHPCHGCVGSNAKHGGALRAINGLKGGAGGSIAVEGAGADKGGDHQSEDGAGSVCPACENCSLWVGQASTCPVGVTRAGQRLLPGAAGGIPVPSGWPAPPWRWGCLPTATPPVGRRSGRRRRWRWFRPAWGGVRFALEFYRVGGAPVKVPRRGQTMFSASPQVTTIKSGLRRAQMSHAS